MKYLDKSEFDKVNVFGIGEFNEGFSQYFTGDSF